LENSVKIQKFKFLLIKIRGLSMNMIYWGTSIEMKKET